MRTCGYIATRLAQARDGAKKEHNKLKKAAEKAAGGLASVHIAKK